MNAVLDIWIFSPPITAPHIHACHIASPTIFMMAGVPPIFRSRPLPFVAFATVVVFLLTLWARPHNPTSVSRWNRGARRMIIHAIAESRRVFAITRG